MKMKIVACLAFLLNTFLFGSYYSVAKGVLGRVDPIVFTFFTMMTLIPPALCIIILSWRQMNRAAVKSGFLLGSCLCLGLFTLSVALKYNSATGTAFFPALNGLLAALFTWLFLRQPITKATWYAGVISVVGAIMLMANASMGGARGSLIAFIGGLFCTFYIFLADQEQKDPAISWPLLGVELLTMALWANLIALLFGDWQFVQFRFPGDLGIVLYIGLGTIFLPTLITVLLQKHISPVTVSFISILEPLLGALVAYIYLHEVLPLDGYLGGGLVVIGALIHTWSSVERPSSVPALRRSLAMTGQWLNTSMLGMLLYPLLCCGVGVFIVCKIGGFPPPSWRELYHIWPHLPALLQHGQSTTTILLLAQALCWLVAWSALIIMGFIATYRALDKIFTASSSHEYTPTRVATELAPVVAHLPHTSHNVAFANHDNHKGLPLRGRLDRDAPGEITMGMLIAEQRLKMRDPAMVTHPLELDVRALRQRGYAPHPPSAEKHNGDPLHIRERRQARKVRLASLHGITTAESSSRDVKSEMILSTNQESYNDHAGNDWHWWEDIGAREVREQ